MNTKLRVLVLSIFKLDLHFDFTLLLKLTRTRLNKYLWLWLKHCFIANAQTLFIIFRKLINNRINAV